MISKILPILFLAAGTAGGITAAKLTGSPAVQTPAEDARAKDNPGPDDPAAGHETKPDAGSSDDSEYVRLNNQFVVPLVSNEKVVALVVLTLSLEVTPTARETVFEREPKLRDSFLQVLFDQANLGRFTGNFTKVETVRQLKTSLLEAARKELGAGVSDVLVESIARQDV